MRAGFGRGESAPSGGVGPKLTRYWVLKTHLTRILLQALVSVDHPDLMNAGFLDQSAGSGCRNLAYIS